MLPYKIRVIINLLEEKIDEIIDEYNELYIIEKKNNETKNIDVSYIYKKLYEYYNNNLKMYKIPVYLKYENLTQDLVIIIENTKILNRKGVKTLAKITFKTKLENNVKNLDYLKTYFENLKFLLNDNEQIS